MDSSFLNWIHMGLGGLSGLMFFKMVIQFGLPNHPLRFIAYIVSLCIFLYFSGLMLTDFGFISPWDWMRWRVLPLIVGSLCLLFQTITLVGSFGLLQQKVISRLPIIGAVLCFAIIPEYADQLMTIFLLCGGLFLLFGPKKSRYQKRLYFKMVFLYMFHIGLSGFNYYSFYLLGHVVLLLSIFYLFIFQHSFCLMALLDDFNQTLDGDS